MTQDASISWSAGASFVATSNKTHIARVGWSAEAAFSAAPNQTYAASVILIAEGGIEPNDAYLGKPTSIELLMETDGASTVFPGSFAYIQDASTYEVVMFFEMEGNAHGSLVVPYVQDTDGGKPPRLLGQPVEGQPEAAEKLFRFHAADSAYRISEARSRGWADSPATADAVFTLERKRGITSTTVATVTFYAGASAPQIEVIDASVVVGDRLIFHAPTVQDITLANLVVTFVLIFA